MLCLLVAAAACGGDSGSGPNGSSCVPSATQICMQSSSFHQATLTVSAGATVVWQNSDGTTHTTTSSAVPATATSWDRTVNAGGSTTVTLTVPGTYEYYCRFHGSPGAGMHGTIIVQ